MEKSSSNYERKNYKTKVEIYKEKLNDRNSNQNWILSNYIGKPGGGAPLKDKSGNTITKMRTIANGQIYLYPSKNFTKGENLKSNEMQKNFSQTYSKQSQIQKDFLFTAVTPQQSIDNILQNQDLSIYNNNNINNINNISKSAEYSHHNQLNQLHNFPYPAYPYIPYAPYPYPYLYLYPPIYYYPSYSSYSSFNHSNQRKENEIPLNINAKETQQSNIIKQVGENTITNQYENNDSYNIPTPKEEKNNYEEKETQKKQWLRELLEQIEDKKKRVEIEKKRLEEQEKLKEEKYKEYLKLKEEQEKQQEVKRKIKGNKKLKGVLLKESEQYNNEQGDNNNQSQSLSTDGINNQLSSNENLKINKSGYIPLNLLDNPDNFINLIDSQFKNLNIKLLSDLDREKEIFKAELQSKYIRVPKNNHNTPHLGESTIISQRKEQISKHIKNMHNIAEEESFLNFILFNQKSKGPKYNNPEIDVKYPTFFGRNRDKIERKYVNKRAGITIFPNEDDDLYRENCNFNEITRNGDLIGKYDRRKWDKWDVELQGGSSFIPMNEEIKEKPGERLSRGKIINKGNKEYKEMFNTLGEIKEINMERDPSLDRTNKNDKLNEIKNDIKNEIQIDNSNEKENEKQIESQMENQIENQKQNEGDNQKQSESENENQNENPNEGENQNQNEVFNSNQMEMAQQQISF